MANSNGAFGLRPSGKVGQNPANGGMTEYRIAYNNTSPIYRGTPVIPLNTGLIDVGGAASGGTVGLLGAFWGCEFVSSVTGEKVYSPYWPGSGADSDFPVKAFIYDDPMQTFIIATSNVTASFNTEAEVRAAVFANADFALATSGTTATGISTATLDLNTIGTTNTLNLRIMGFVDDPENSDFTAAGVGVLVRLNNHFNSPNGAAAGGTVSTTGI